MERAERKKPEKGFKIDPQYCHPQWQKKRLEVMESAGFSCEKCGNTEKMLNVHHRFYRRGRKMYEYERSELVCLCEDCHKTTHEYQDQMRELLEQLDPSQIEQVVGYLKGLVIEPCIEDGMVINISTWPEVDGFARATGIPFEIAATHLVGEVGCKTIEAARQQQLNSIKKDSQK